MRRTKVHLAKSQSILEYLIVLTAIIVTILANTVGLRRGLQNNLDQNQKVIEENVKGSEAPQEVKGEAYYALSRERSDSRWNENKEEYNYTATNFNKDQYYFHEGPSDMGYVPADGTVLDSDKPAGPDWGSRITEP